MAKRSSAKRLTDPGVRKLTVTEQTTDSKTGKPVWKQREVWDALVPTMGVRVSGTPERPVRSWFVFPRVFRAGADGAAEWRPTRITFGTPDADQAGKGRPYLSLAEARAKAREILQAAAERRDPVREQAEQAEQHAAQLEAEQRAKADTYAAARTLYLAELEQRVKRGTLREKSFKEYRNALSMAYFRHWESMPLRAIDTKEVRRLVTSIVDGKPIAGAGKRARKLKPAPVMANRVLVYLGPFFKWAKERDHIDAVPTEGVRKPTKEQARERVLSDDELRCIWASLEAYEGVGAGVVKMLMILGQRETETARMRWADLSDIDGDQPEWLIPRDDRKGKVPHLVPLPPLAIEIIRAQPRVKDHPQVFSSPRGGVFNGFSALTERLRERSIEIASQRGNADAFAEPWTLHDLRRTMATRMADPLGVPPEFIEATLSHSGGRAKVGVAGVYNRAQYRAEKRAALDVWARYLEELIGITRTDHPVGRLGKHPNYLRHYVMLAERAETLTA